MRGWCVCGLIPLICLVYSFHYTSFMHPKEACLVFGNVVLAVLLALDRRSFLQGLCGFLPLVCAVFAAGIIYALIAPVRVPGLAIEEGLRFSALLLFGILVWDLCREETWCHRILCALSLTGAAAGGLAVAQYFSVAGPLFPVFPGYAQRVYSVFGNQDLLGAYLALTLPLTIALAWGRRSRSVFYLFLFVQGVALVLSGSRSAWLAAAAGMVAALAMAPPQSGKRALMAFTCVALGVIAGAIPTGSEPLERIQDSFGDSDTGGRIRLWVWAGTTRMILDHPVLGVGPGNFAYWSPSYLGAVVSSPEGHRYLHNEIHTLHAHSEPLELLAETGVIGLLFLFWLMARLRWTQGAAWGGAGAIVVVSLFNATLHSIPHAAAAILLLAMILRDSFTTGSKSEPAGALRWTPIFLSVLIAAAHLYLVVIPSHRLAAAEDAHLRGEEDAATLYPRAIQHALGAPYAREEYGLYLLDRGLFPEALAALKSSESGLDTGRLHLLLGLVSESLEQWEEAEYRYLACLARWPGNEMANAGLTRIEAARSTASGNGTIGPGKLPEESLLE